MSGWGVGMAGEITDISVRKGGVSETRKKKKTPDQYEVMQVIKVCGHLMGVNV